MHVANIRKRAQEVLEDFLNSVLVCHRHERVEIALKQIGMENVFVGEDLDGFSLLHYKIGATEGNQLVGERVVLEEEGPVVRKLEDEFVTKSFEFFHGFR